MLASIIFLGAAYVSIASVFLSGEQLGSSPRLTVLEMLYYLVLHPSFRLSPSLPLRASVQFPLVRLQQGELKRLGLPSFLSCDVDSAKYFQVFILSKPP